MEKHISRYMCQCLTKYNLLLDSHFGMNSNHPRQTVLVNIIDKCVEEVKNGNINVVILLDLNMSFDVVDHDIMFKKLVMYGFKFYMTNRTQIGKVLSDKFPVQYGVQVMNGEMTGLCLL